MVGSIYALWPFKQFQFIDLYMKRNEVIVMVPQMKIYTNQLKLYFNFEQLWPVLLSFAAGSIIMIFFIRYERKKNEDE